jgi:putative ABC transport system permease protein
MRIWSRIRLWCRAAMRRSRMESEMDAELRFHIDGYAEDLVRGGVAREEAMRRARIEFGGIERVKEEGREARGVHFLETFFHDLRYSTRMLRKNPGFTIVAVLTLALGIGANTAMFSVINTVLLRPLPYPDSDRLMFEFLTTAKNGPEQSSYGTADYLAVRDGQQSFSHFAGIALGEGSFTYTGGPEPQKVRGTAATGDFFGVLGVEPLLGRTFDPANDRPGKQREVVLSYRFWKTEYGGDPGVVGRTMMLDGASYDIVGVMPAGFHFGPRDNDDIWPVLQLEPRNVRPPYWIGPLGRLKPGVTQAQAEADLSRIAEHEQKLFPNSPYDSARLVSMKPFLVGDFRIALLTLQGAVLLVMLIAIVNVANLQIARASVRERELAIRAALGARRGRILRQLLTESTALAMIGGVLGLLLAQWGLQALLNLDPGAFPRMSEVRLDSRVLAVTASVSLLSGIFFGFAPILRGSGLRLGEGLKGSATGSSQQSGRHRLLGVLVVAEFSLSLILLAGAGLLVRSFDHLSSTTPGFSPQHLLTMQLSLHSVRYPKELQVAEFYRQLLDRLQELPGVQSAGLSMSLPPHLLAMENPFRMASEPIIPGKELHLAEEMTISPGYFQTLGVPLIRGRFFTDADRNRKDQIVLINENMAKQYFAGQDPVGQRIQTGDADPHAAWETIVGVVGNVKYQGLDAKPEPTLYVPYFEEGWTSWSREMFVVLRSSANEATLMPAVREAVWSMDKQLPIASVRSMDALLADSVMQPRFRTVLLGIFASLALVLSAAGIYGVISYSVLQRTQEIGIRMALGANLSDVLRLVLGQGAKLALFGVAIGVPAALALTRLMQSLLFETSASDPLTLIAVTLLLTLVGMLACLVPAWRAMRVDPMVALRYE